MHVVALAVQLDQLGLEVGADLGEDSSECFDSLAIKAAVAAFGDKDQMDVHCRSAMPAVSKVLDFVHGPDNNESMERRQAFRFQLMPNGEQQGNNRIQLPKIGWVRYRNSREVLGEIRSVTVSQSAGQWYVSVNTLPQVEPPRHAFTAVVGIDWGVAQFITPSEGQPVDRMSPLKKFLPKLKQLQRRLARKQKFSNNWKKAKVTQLYQRIANTRKHFLHKVSSDISKNHAVVMVEDLQVKNMSASAAGTREQPGRNVKAKSGLNRSILDASPFELRRQLEYKTRWRGGMLVAVPPQNTSRKCPECQHTAAENRKRQAKFVCVECGFSAPADYVGAVNIKEAGFALLACSQPSPEARASWQEPTEATRVQACA